MRFTSSSPRVRSSLRVGLCASAFAGSLGLAQSSAEAQTTLPVVACDTLPNPIYGIGGSAATPLIKRVGTILSAGTNAEPAITVIYSDPGACQAMQGLVTGTPITGTAKYWVSGNTSDQTCTLPTNGHEAEWGSMAQQATTCANITALPNTVGDYLGPISGFSLIVPVNSTEQVISAEALYSIYGLGAAEANITPWINPATLGTRTTTSAAGLLLAKAVGIPLTRALKGIVGKDQNAVIATVTTGAAITDPNSALGFVSTESADANRAKVRSLAYQHKDQLTGYYPDSDTTALDKINLREGRYFLWNPHHFFARTDTRKNIVNPNLAKFISYVTSAAPLPGPKPFIDVTIENGNVPVCAMHVTRDDDMGPLASFQPDEPCGCYFDEKATGSTTCTPCTTDAQCTDAAAPKCRHNFCEVK